MSHYFKKKLFKLKPLIIMFFLANIFVGKASGSPKFGCPFCSAPSPYTKPGKLLSTQYC